MRSVSLVIGGRVVPEEPVGKGAAGDSPHIGRQLVERRVGGDEGGLRLICGSCGCSGIVGVREFLELAFHSCDHWLFLFTMAATTTSTTTTTTTTTIAATPIIVTIINCDIISDIAIATATTTT